MFHTSFPFLLSLSSISIAAVNAIAFNAPIATPILLQAYADTTGWTPIPTTNPQSLLELFRRQAQADPGLCGYIKGDPESPISCDVGSCMFNADLKWFGCCTGSAPGDCDLQTACVEAKSAERCRADSACASDKSVLFCTDPQAPSCALFLTTTSGDAQKTHSHWVCGASPTNLALYPTPSLHSSDDINNIAALTANGDKPFYAFDAGERKTETQIQGSTTTNGAAAVNITPTPSTVSASVTVQGGVSASRSTGAAAALGSGRTGEVVLTVGVVVIGVGVLFG